MRLGVWILMPSVAAWHCCIVPSCERTSLLLCAGTQSFWGSLGHRQGPCLRLPSVILVSPWIPQCSCQVVTRRAFTKQIPLGSCRVFYHRNGEPAIKNPCYVSMVQTATTRSCSCLARGCVSPASKVGSYQWEMSLCDLCYS